MRFPLSEQAFKRLISGEQRGLSAVVGRSLLRIASTVYGGITAVRNKAFDCGLKSVHKVDVPVISVGNLTAGGTGKTPVVAAVVNMLSAASCRPGIVSRGYRADASGENDEKRVLRMLCPDVPHEQNPDRIVAARRLIACADVDVIVLDDAFQHRRIHRDLNIVLIDATNPFGYNHLLPRGLLREPLNGLRRADMVFITRADAVSEESLLQTEATLRQACSQIAGNVFRVSFPATRLLARSGEWWPVESIRGDAVLVMTGIGNPAAFVETCRKIGADVRETRFFPDHHHYERQEVLQVAQHAQRLGATVLTTVKDIVKLDDCPENIVAVDIECQFEMEGSEQLVRDKVLQTSMIRTQAKQ